MALKFRLFRKRSKTVSPNTKKQIPAEFVHCAAVWLNQALSADKLEAHNPSIYLILYSFFAYSASEKVFYFSGI